MIRVIVPDLPKDKNYPVDTFSVKKTLKCKRLAVDMFYS